MPYEDAEYYNNCLVYAVTKECALALVSDALLTKDYEIHKVLRVEHFNENTTEHLYEVQYGENQPDNGVVISTIEQYIWDFLNTKQLTFGNFIFPEDSNKQNLL